jgi:hypothetical protein
LLTGSTLELARGGVGLETLVSWEVVELRR